MWRLPVVFAILAASLPACVTTSRVFHLDEVEIADAAVLQLPEREAMGDSLDATQLITGTYEEQTYTMQVQLEWRPGSMVFAAFNVWGTAAFSLTYDGDEVQIQGSPLLMRAVRPENVLADILLTYWEFSRLDSRLHGDGLTLVDTVDTRTISRNGTPIIVIGYGGESRWEGSVRFEHLERQYVLEIQTLGYSRT